MKILLKLFGREKKLMWHDWFLIITITSCLTVLVLGLLGV